MDWTGMDWSGVDWTGVAYLTGAFKLYSLTSTFCVINKNHKVVEIINAYRFCNVHTH